MYHVMKEGKESGGMCKIDDIFSGVFKILFRQRGLAERLSLIGPHISWLFSPVRRSPTRSFTGT